MYLQCYLFALSVCLSSRLALCPLRVMESTACSCAFRRGYTLLVCLCDPWRSIGMMRRTAGQRLRFKIPWIPPPDPFQPLSWIFGDPLSCQPQKRLRDLPRVFRRHDASCCSCPSRLPTDCDEPYREAWSPSAASPNASYHVIPDDERICTPSPVLAHSQFGAIIACV